MPDGSSPLAPGTGAEPLRSIVILGGGTAGWMAAAALSKAWQHPNRPIVLIESDDIGTVGVGEASVPSLRIFNRLLGIDVADFIRECNGTFKLGIEFVGWGGVGRRYMHPFTGYGLNGNDEMFMPLWLKHARLTSCEGKTCDLDEYNLSSLASTVGCFSLDGPPLNHAYHFDATLYAQYLRRHAESRGVIRIEGKAAHIKRDDATGHILSVQLESGQVVSGDFFIDCSGFRALLIGEALQTPYEDWSRWLPCDRAVATGCETTGTLVPYTRSTADAAGWRWRIPLQHRTGNGYVYASAWIDDDAAERRLLETLDGEASGPVRRLRFVTGRRRQAWVGNCLALGLAAGFMEPLESTSIHLIQSSILRLISLFPDKGFEPAEIAEFNRQTADEYDDIRDFLITHYKLTERDDTPFWRHCRDMAVPDRVTDAIALFQARGRLGKRPVHLFSPQSWLAVLVGQGGLPRGDDPLLEDVQPQALAHQMRDLRETLGKLVDRMPRHEDVLKGLCAPGRPAPPNPVRQVISAPNAFGSPGGF